MVLTWSATTRKAVEKAGPWTRWKTKPRFPTASTAPWKSRKPSEIPTFPPPLRFALSLPNQRRRGLLEAKPDNSRVNKTGQLDLLTTQPVYVFPETPSAQSPTAVLGACD